MSGYTVGPGIGLGNIFLYWGAERSGFCLAIFAAAPVLAAPVAIGLLFEGGRGHPRRAVARSAASAEAVAVPLFLGALAPLSSD